MPPAENFSVWAVPETVNAIRSNTIILLFVINLFFWFVKNSKRPESLNLYKLNYFDRKKLLMVHVKNRIFFIPDTFNQVNDFSYPLAKKIVPIYTFYVFKISSV